LATASDEQYEGIPDDEIALLARKFHTLHRFRKERRISPRDFFECGDTTHFITDCPKRKKLDSSNKYNYNNQNDSSDKGEGKKKYRLRNNNNKKFQKRVLPSAISTSPAMTPPAQRRMRSPSVRQSTSPAFALWASLRDTSLTLTLM
jgi:hypothetical protein